MKKIAKSLFLAFLAGFLVVGSVSAFGIPAGYDYINADPFGAPVITDQDDGIFLWTNDANLRSWSVRWTASSLTTPSNFTGFIGMSGEPADNPMTLTPISLENHDGYFDFTKVTDTSGSFTPYIGDFATLTDIDSFFFDGAVASGNSNGYDFVIEGDIKPSSLIFNFMNVPYNASIYIGEEKMQLDRNYGLIYAPAPEPTTMVLLGIGLIGIAGIGRRKIS